MEEIDHTYTREIVCPHCGHEQLDSFEFDDEGNEECSECGKNFTYERIVTIEYTTKKA